MINRNLLLAVSFVIATGCSSSGPEPSHLSGKVTFKGQPVPAGYISFEPDLTVGGQIKVLQIKDGVFDSAKEVPSPESEPGLRPGTYQIRIAGFDGKRIPFFGQGKQIFNELEDTYTVPAGQSTHDFVVPESAGENVKIQRTADT
ncbi:MAG: hypothetical protein HY000_16330 [Planctomycetes bacterium]|nr:hypothetical protein [Planctomycetota bacterium]